MIMASGAVYVFTFFFILALRGRLRCVYSKACLEASGLFSLCCFPVLPFHLPSIDGLLHLNIPAI